MTNLPSFKSALKTIAIVCSLVFPSLALGIDSKMKSIKEQITAIENDHGPFAKDLYFPLLSMANLQIEEKFHSDAVETLKRAQSINHRHEGVLNIGQIVIIDKLTELAIIQADFKEANRYQNFAFFLRKKEARDPENLVGAYLGMAEWLANTGQLSSARSALRQGSEFTESESELTLQLLLQESRVRRLDNLCCGWKKLREQLDQQPDINSDLLKAVYFEIADSLILNRKPEEASKYYQMGYALLKTEEMLDAKMIEMKAQLRSSFTANSKYYFVENELAYPRKIREMTEDEIENHEGFEPTWLKVNTSSQGFTLPDKGDGRRMTRESRDLLGDPLIFQGEQLRNIQSLKNKNKEEVLEINLSFDVEINGDLNNVEVVSSNASSRIDRLLVNSLKKLYFRPAITKDGLVLSRNILLSQKIDLRDGDYK